MAGLKVNGGTAHADLARGAVPANERMSKGSLTMAWWAVCSAMFYIVVAAILAAQYGTVDVIIGMLLSAVCFGVINGVISRYAISTGLSVAQFSRILFGNTGAALATLIFFATAIYYAVFEGSVIAIGINYLFPSVSMAIASLIVVGYSVPLVFGSIQNWLDKLNGVLLPFYVIGLLGTVGVAIYLYGYSNAWLVAPPAQGASAYGWWNCFVYFMGIWILMMFTFDYARFGKVKDATYHARFTFGTPFYLVSFLFNGLAGIFLVKTVPMAGALTEVSVVLALLKIMGFAGLVFVWATQTRINTANYFLASVNMSSFFEMVLSWRLPKAFWAIVVGAIVYVLMLSNVFEYILQALSYQGVFVVAWVAIALTHICSPEGRAESLGRLPDGSRIPALRMAGLVAWGAGTAVGIALMFADAGAYASASAPMTAIVASVAYAVGSARQRTALAPSI